MRKERRALTRIPFEQTVFWNLNSTTRGTGMVSDVSRGGLKINLDEAVRTGPVIELTVDSILYNDGPVCLQALVRWCEPSGQGPLPYEAGLSIIHGDPKVLGAISEVFYTAIRRIRMSSDDMKIVDLVSDRHPQAS